MSIYLRDKLALLFFSSVEEAFLKQECLITQSNDKGEHNYTQKKGKQRKLKKEQNRDRTEVITLMERKTMNKKKELRRVAEREQAREIGGIVLQIATRDRWRNERKED